MKRSLNKIKMFVEYNIYIALLLLLIGCFFGCATGTGAHRFYAGPPLPKDEISLLYAFNGCKIRNVLNKIEDETRHLDFLHNAASEMLDLIPGEYILGITFSHSSSSMGNRTHVLGDKVQLKLNAKPGNTYLIYPEISTQNNWKPVIVNMKNYSPKECEVCPSKDKIQKQIKEYLQSERPILRFHPLSETSYYKTVTEEAKQNIKGFWW